MPHLIRDAYDKTRWGCISAGLWKDAPMIRYLFSIIAVVTALNAFADDTAKTSPS